MTQRAQTSDVIIDGAISSHINRSAERLSQALTIHMQSSFSPDDKKVLRTFSIQEASELIGTSVSNLRKLHHEGKVPEVHVDARGKRHYKAEEIQEIRKFLARTGRNFEVYTPGKRLKTDETIVISIANFKGGSTKTTCSALFSQRLAARGYRVLAIDLDPQASLTSIFGYRPELDFSEEGTIYDCLRYEDPDPIKEIIRKTYFPNLDIAPSGILLSEYETETALSLTSKDKVDVPFFARLSGALDKVSDDYDVVIIDCPPQIGFLTLTALCASTGVITPIVPSMVDVASMAQFLMLAASLIKYIEKNGVNLNWKFMKYLISRYEPSENSHQQMAAFLRMINGDDVMENNMLKSAAISQASLLDKTIYEAAPGDVDKRTLDRMLTNMNDICHEIEILIQKSWGRDPSITLRKEH